MLGKRRQHAQLRPRPLARRGIHQAHPLLPRLEYERAERNFLWKLYENEVIPLLRELRLADETKRPPRFEADAHASLTKLYMDRWPDLLIRWHDFDENLPPDPTGHA
jgi:hypothetical protein